MSDGTDETCTEEPAITIETEEESQEIGRRCALAGQAASILMATRRAPGLAFAGTPAIKADEIIRLTEYLLHGEVDSPGPAPLLAPSPRWTPDPNLLPVGHVRIGDIIVDPSTNKPVQVLKDPVYETGPKGMAWVGLKVRSEGGMVRDPSFDPATLLQVTRPEPIVTSGPKGEFGKITAPELVVGDVIIDSNVWTVPMAGERVVSMVPVGPGELVEVTVEDAVNPIAVGRAVHPLSLGSNATFTVRYPRPV